MSKETQQQINDICLAIDTWANKFELVVYN